MSIDEQILETIAYIRKINNACTAGAVSNHLRLSKSYVVQRCDVLRAAGLVDWTSMAGSLHRVAAVAVDPAPDTVLPDGSRLVVATDAVFETGGATTPAAPGAVAVGNNLTDTVVSGETVGGDDGHGASLSREMKSKSRSKSSGT